jgi:hypothetical protein
LYPLHPPFNGLWSLFIKRIEGLVNAWDHLFDLCRCLTQGPPGAFGLAN